MVVFTIHSSSASTTLSFGLSDLLFSFISAAIPSLCLPLSTSFDHQLAEDMDSYYRVERCSLLNAHAQIHTILRARTHTKKAGRSHES